MDTIRPKLKTADGEALGKAKPEPRDAMQENDQTEAVVSPSLRIEVDARGVSLGVLAVLALVFALQWARDFLVPLLFGILIAYTLNPIMNWLCRIKVPRIVGASLLLSIMIAGAIGAGNSLRGEFVSIVEELPTATQKLSRAVAKLRNGVPDTLQQMRAAANELEKATKQAAGISPTPSKALPPGQPVFKLSEWLWAGSMGALGFVSQVAMVLFLVFFLLLSGDTFKRKLVKLAGSLTKKKIALQILDDINSSVQRYMSMLVATNTLLALLMWGVLRWIGLENAGAWAVVAGFVHVIPYFGPLFITTALSLTAFMQFESFSMMLLVAGASLAIATFVGMLVTTWMAGRIAKMNAAAVFIGLIFWGWLWGIWGLLLGIPIIVIVKVVAEHIEGMQPLAELLGD